jgi:WXXGXW repeat (2 copies)
METMCFDEENSMSIKTAVAMCVAAALSLPALPALAAVWVQQAPPEVRIDQPTEVRTGYQWVPGYWDWRGRRHVWVAGTWVRERPGYVYVAPTWIEDGGRWRLEVGRWSRRDRDGDGVPNRLDRDRDGDGVRNRADDRPNNPNRR